MGAHEYPDDEKVQFLAQPFIVAEMAKALLALGATGGTTMDSAVAPKNARAIALLPRGW